MFVYWRLSNATNKGDRQALSTARFRRASQLATADTCNIGLQAHNKQRQVGAGSRDKVIHIEIRKKQFFIMKQKGRQETIINNNSKRICIAP